MKAVGRWIEHFQTSGNDADSLDRRREALLRKAKEYQRELEKIMVCIFLFLEPRCNYAADLGNHARRGSNNNHSDNNSAGPTKKERTGQQVQTGKGKGIPRPATCAH
jgi:hypothetical protein